MILFFLNIRNTNIKHKNMEEITQRVSTNKSFSTTIINKQTLEQCFQEWKDIDPAIIKLLNSREKTLICGLTSLIKKEKEENSKKVWTSYFSKYEYLNFDVITKDDCIFFFLTIEDELVLKPQGIHKIIKGLVY